MTNVSPLVGSLTTVCGFQWLLRLQRKLLILSTRMCLPIWFQSGHGLDCSTSLPRGLKDLSQQSPNRRQVGLWNSLVRERRYVTLAKWVTEVGHWPPSTLGNFSVIKETHFSGVNCVELLQCELLLWQLHLHKIHESTDNLNWRIGSYSHFRNMNIELMSCQKNPSSHLHPQLPTRPRLCFAM